MSYTVIHYFEDLQDFNHPYKVGDKFPRLGLDVSESRLKELSSDKNRQKKALIVKDEEPVIEIENKYTKTEINRMSTSELQALAVENGVDNAEERTGSELKKILIEIFSL